MSSHIRKRCAKRTLDELIRESAPANSKARIPYWRLVGAIRASSQLLHPEPFRGDALLASHADVLRACVQIVSKRGFWKRRPETWVAPNANLFEQFKSLVSHLFERFDVPMFLTPAWCSADRKSWQIDLYLHLAAGRSIRQFEWPLPYPVQMTKREARWFMQAPDDCFVIGAWRWAQVRALGGDRRLAGILTMAPALLIPTEHEEF